MSLSNTSVLSEKLALGDRLKEASLEIPRQGLSMLLGPSGSGKSTFAELILGRLRPTAGAISYWGSEMYVNKPPETSGFAMRVMNFVRLETQEDRRRQELIARELGFVAQRPHVPKHIGSGDFIFISHQVRGNAIDPTYFRELTSKLGITTLLDKKFSDMSIGEQQRLAIANALAHQPRLLIADEPTASLDLETSEQVLDITKGLVETQGMAALWITHNPDDRPFADHVFEARDGIITQAA